MNRLAIKGDGLMRKCIQCNQPIHETIHIYNLFKPPQIFCERCETLWLNSKFIKMVGVLSALTTKFLLMANVMTVNS